jgi:hypothetical protein
MADTYDIYGEPEEAGVQPPQQSADAPDVKDVHGFPVPVSGGYTSCSP